MNDLTLYRRRIIPQECRPLTGDEIILADDEVVITKWTTINPKTEFTHGCSCYFLKQGFKVSKFYRHDGSLLYWYCDIVDFDFDPSCNELYVTDLLADVIVNPDGSFRVVDLDELADAYENHLISSELMITCLRRLDDLLSMIYRDKFDRLQNRLDSLNL